MITGMIWGSTWNAVLLPKRSRAFLHSLPSSKPIWWHGEIAVLHMVMRHIHINQFILQKDHTSLPLFRMAHPHEPIYLLKDPKSLPLFRMAHPHEPIYLLKDPKSLPLFRMAHPHEPIYLLKDPKSLPLFIMAHPHKPIYLPKRS